MTHRPAGFTMIEMMIVVGIIAILALMALPSLQGKLVRDQIVEAMALADVARKPVAATWAHAGVLPADNAEAGLPAPDRIVSNLVTSVTVEGGAIHVTFGHRANGAIRGRVLSLRPAVVDDAHVVPVAWVCGHAAAPGPMRLYGSNRTDVADRYLPLNCLAP
jgi:type IV pilus assembly protein PilA